MNVDDGYMKKMKMKKVIWIRCRWCTVRFDWPHLSNSLFFL